MVLSVKFLRCTNIYITSQLDSKTWCMAGMNMTASAFSSDGKYFGHLSAEGKLKVWNVLSNTFEQEYTPNFHLTSPSTCLHFVQLQTGGKANSPRKKVKRKESEILFPHVVLGTSTGLLLVYSVARADVDFKIDSGTSQPVNCISWDNESFIYSGVDQNILCWDLNNRRVWSKWKSGNEKITALLVIPKNMLLTASKSIRLWDIKSQEVLKTFTGHSSEVTLLKYVNPRKNSDLYFISGSKSDRLLNCWVSNESNETKIAVASFLMEDIAYSVSIVVGSDYSVNMAAVTRSGVVHIYQHTLNGKCNKPLKPRTTLQVASDIDQNNSQNNSLVTPIPIVAALFQEDLSITICHGNILAFTFENVAINTYEKVQCLVRNNSHKIRPSKVQGSKTRTPITGNHVQYLTPYTSSTSAEATAKRKGGQQEVPMEQRLDNLTLNKLDTDSKVPKADNLAQLLVQGLHSKDKKILRTVLSRREESVIKNTIKRLPLPVIAPLAHELTSYIQGKTLMSHIGTLWLKHLLQVHAGLLLSNPELANLLGPLITNVERRLSLQTPLSKLKGRLDLLISQVNVGTSSQDDDDNKALLVYNDKDTNDSEVEEMEVPVHADSENEWVEEESEGDGESASEMSTCEISD